MTGHWTRLMPGSIAGLSVVSQFEIASAMHFLLGRAQALARRPSHGESAISGSDFEGIAWDVPGRPEGRRPKRVGRFGEPGGIRTHGHKIKSSGDLPEFIRFRTASGTSGPAVTPRRPLVYPRSPPIATYTDGGRAGDADSAGTTNKMSPRLQCRTACTTSHAVAVCHIL